MQYYSLNKSASPVDFRTATLQGQAPDKGLYFPEHIPVLDKALIAGMDHLSKEELGLRVMLPYAGGSIPEEVLYHIIAETVSFPFPLVEISAGISSLELFHGPTLAFKDVGARFMSRCLGYFSEKQNRETTVLVATSGDTGGAVANGFLGVEGVRVVILYPSGKVSPVQELQLTTCGANITALEVTGSFDDCQAMVKEAFMDADLQKISLTSANSINVARWLPQQLYYFYAYQQWKSTQPPVIAVPSGNFGNLCAGLLANASGLPVQHFIAACNENDIVPDYLASGNYTPRKAVATLSNAMDVGDPSNFVRILQLFKHDHHKIAAAVTGYRVSDETTLETIRDVKSRYGYLLDPHGAVAYNALDQYLNEHPDQKGFLLETAHPVKFPQTVAAATGQEPEVPEAAKHLFHKTKHSIPMRPQYEALKEWLLQ
ncbi:threonine synthase [Sediminibacterium ginsengisoli]|uniref:Threonine synthase n=1 Tax=Sediminibacterium ginsengisoli TaxID=413434 RepID=A0A1T4RG73_9BACT|nr:threonine synthase [Sediminibacterium ginsengisoli]SKA14985.1 threonine synthase [Sediminibacterium ginsengisoli]